MHELHKHSYLWIQDVLLGYLFSNIMDVDIFWETHRKRYRLRQASARYRCSQLRQASARLQENVVSAKAPTNIFDVFLKKFNIPIMSSLLTSDSPMSSWSCWNYIDSNQRSRNPVLEGCNYWNLPQLTGIDSVWLTLSWPMLGLLMLGLLMLGWLMSDLPMSNWHCWNCIAWKRGKRNHDH